ncbi:TPA: structural protein, partial [Pseudomonas aeruginosa]|nr:structural protein [Pseudomonas aeruginosa]
NNTRAYALAVARAMGVPPQASLHLDQATLVALVTAIIHQENGQQPYSTEQIAQAVREVL